MATIWPTTSAAKLRFHSRSAQTASRPVLETVDIQLTRLPLRSQKSEYVNRKLLLSALIREVMHRFVGQSPSPDGVAGKASVMDFREEAKGCLLLAQVETHPEVRTILLGMVLGWLALAKEAQAVSPRTKSRDELASA